MKAYKAFNSDWTCRSFQYKVGETYTTDKPIELCENGFHFCKELKDCYYFYPFVNFPKIAEVEVLGEYLEENIKGCTNKIKIIREIPLNEQLKIMGIDEKVWEKLIGFYQMAGVLGLVGSFRNLGGNYGPFYWSVSDAFSYSDCIIGRIANSTFLIEVWNKRLLVATIDPTIPSQKELLYNIKLPTVLTFFLKFFLYKYYP